MEIVETQIVSQEEARPLKLIMMVREVSKFRFLACFLNGFGARPSDVFASTTRAAVYKSLSGGGPRGTLPR